MSSKWLTRLSRLTETAHAPPQVVTRDPRAEESASQKVASGGSDACGQVRFGR